MSISTQDFYKSTITKNIGAGIGNLYISVAPTMSAGILVISPNNTVQREIVRYTSQGTDQYGAYVVISDIAHRGMSGTTAQTHSIGEPVRMNITAIHWDEMQDEIDAIVAGDFIPPGTAGNILISNGSSWVSSAPTDGGQISTTILISSAELKALAATTKTLIAATGAGKAIVLDDVTFNFT